MPYIMSGQGNPVSLTFWGPDNQKYPSSNNFTVSKQGGNFLAIDGDYGRSKVSQTVSGLDPSKTYELAFEYAGAQQAGFDGSTDQKWIVTVDVSPRMWAPGRIQAMVSPLGKITP